MNKLLKYSLFENIRQGKAILSKNDVSEHDPRWLSLLEIFQKAPGYVGDFAFLVFEKGWTIDGIRFIKDNYIDNPANKNLFNKIYPDIRKYKEEKFLDKMMSMLKDKNIAAIFSEFPARQKELIDKSKQKDKLLYELSLRNDVKTFLKKVARYHTTKDLVDSIKLFLSGEALTKHKDIFEKIEESGAQIIKNDAENNLIIAKVNYSQLRRLGSHTSWCILSEGTFNSYTKNGEQYMIFLTDNVGNSSLIGTTIGLDVNTSHMVDDSYVSKENLEKILKDRNFDLSTLYQRRGEYIETFLKHGSVFELFRKGFSKDEVYPFKNKFTYHEFRRIEESDPSDIEKYNLTFDNILDNYEWEKIDIEDREKYKLKYRDSNRINRQQVIEDFENGYLVEVDYHLETLFDKFGFDIIPFISNNVSFRKVNPSLIPLVEKIEDIQIRTYEQAVSRIYNVDTSLLKFLIDRKIQFNDDKFVVAAKSASRFGVDAIGMLKLRPSLFRYLKGDMISNSGLQKIEEIKKLDITEEDMSEVIFEIEKRNADKLINQVIPDVHYEHWNRGNRNTLVELAKLADINGLTGYKIMEPELFLGDDVWGVIKKYKLWRGDKKDVYLLYAFMSAAKLNRLDELNKVDGLKPMFYSTMGKLIRSAFQKPGSDYGYKYNSRTYVTKDFWLTDKERENLFTWLNSNFDETELRSNISNYIIDKSVARHESFSLIYYVYGWGFDRYFKVIENVKPLKDDVWTKDPEKESPYNSIVEKSRKRPKYFEHIFSYLNTLGKLDEVVELVDKILNMKDLRKYEVDSLLNVMTSHTGYSDSKLTADQVLKACRNLFTKHGYFFTDRKYYYGYDD